MFKKVMLMGLVVVVCYWTGLRYINTIKHQLIEQNQLKGCAVFKYIEDGTLHTQHVKEVYASSACLDRVLSIDHAYGRDDVSIKIWGGTDAKK